MLELRWSKLSGTAAALDRGIRPDSYVTFCTRTTSWMQTPPHSRGSGLNMAYGCKHERCNVCAICAQISVYARPFLAMTAKSSMKREHNFVYKTSNPTSIGSLYHYVVLDFSSDNLQYSFCRQHPLARFVYLDYQPLRYAQVVRYTIVSRKTLSPVLNSSRADITKSIGDFFPIK